MLPTDHPLFSMQGVYDVFSTLTLNDLCVVLEHSQASSQVVFEHQRRGNVHVHVFIHRPDGVLVCPRSNLPFYMGCPIHTRYNIYLYDTVAAHVKNHTAHP